MDDPRSSAPMMEAPLPDRIQLTRDNTGLTIRYRWFSPMFIFLFFFCLFWDGFLIFWYGTALKTPSPSSIALWFPLLHVGVGIGLSYYVLAGFLNWTVVNVGGGGIVIQHGPVPWFGNKRVPVTEVRQIFREETFSNTRNGRTANYHLSAISPRNSKLKLIRNVPAADMALYIEQEIEKALGIKNVKVAGEMPK